MKELVKNRKDLSMISKKPSDKTPGRKPSPHAEAAAAYREAGVDLERGYEVVRRIKEDLESTKRPGALDSLGRFGGLFDLSLLGLKEPVLVSGTDGVGSKLLLAMAMNQHDTIGIDAVAMCVNDVLVQGAEPLFFLDYIALAKADPKLVAEIVSGVARGCRETNCALIGGETAEMSDLYVEGHYDLAGFCCGVVEKAKLISGENVQSGDLILGLPSSGCHSNGFSLLRKIYFKDHAYRCESRFPELEKSLGETLLCPTRLYVKPVLALLKGLEGKIHGMAHITGGGFFENVPRMSPHCFRYVFDKKSWIQPPIFALTQKIGGLSETEMFNIFNMGIGYMIALPAEQAETAIAILKSAGQAAAVIGHIEEGEGVILE